MSSIAVPAPSRSAPLALEEAIAPGPRRLDPGRPNVFVIPAFNEEENLPRLFRDLEARPGLFPPESRVLIVDDGSQDGTASLVERYEGPLHVELIRLGENQGPGAAFRAGFAAALDCCPEDGLVVTLEADTTGDLDALPQMIERAHGGAELVLAAWVMVNVSRLRRMLSEGAGFVVRRALGLEATTVSSFFRVYRASILRAGFDRYGEALIRERGFACKAEILAKLAGLGALVEEVPVGLDTSKRIGKSKMPIVRTMLAYWRMVSRERGGRDAIPA